MPRAGEEVPRFLAALFGTCPPNLRFYVWTLPDKRSRWYSPTDVARAASEIAAMDRSDVYVGVSLSDRARGKSQRVELKHAAAIAGLWADVDIAHDEANKK